MNRKNIIWNKNGKEDKQLEVVQRNFKTMKKTYAVIRQDILDEGEGVPVGNKYYHDPYPIEYRWVDSLHDTEDIFEVFFEGEWLEAYSIDFEFSNESIQLAEALNDYVEIHHEDYTGELKEAFLAGWNARGKFITKNLDIK